MYLAFWHNNWALEVNFRAGSRFTHQKSILILINLFQLRTRLRVLLDLKGLVSSTAFPRILCRKTTFCSIIALMILNVFVLSWNCINFKARNHLWLEFLLPNSSLCTTLATAQKWPLISYCIPKLNGIINLAQGNYKLHFSGFQVHFLCKKSVNEVFLDQRI